MPAAPRQEPTSAIGAAPAASTAPTSPTSDSAAPPAAAPAPAPQPTQPRRPTGDAGDGWGRAAAYDAYADGLHTYAIWSLRDHDAAVDALYTTFVIADRNMAQLREPEFTQPWLYAMLRYECLTRAASGGPAPTPVSPRLRPPSGPADPSGSLASLERSLRRAEFHSLEWPESEGLAPAHREVLELTIRHGLDSQGLGLVLGLGQVGHGRIFGYDPESGERFGSGYSSAARGPGSGPASGSGSAAAGTGAQGKRSAGGPVGGGSPGTSGAIGSRGFGVLADAWRELERSLAAVAVAKGPREHCAQLAELTFGWSGRLNATLRAPLTDHVDSCTRCQHYLHTVVGTPAAPTILPFVAAPRALREILLEELADPAAAQRAGVDHAALAARIVRFTADGFPALGDPDPARRRTGRRPANRPPTHATAPAPAPAPAPAAPTVPTAPAAANGKSPNVYRSPGSWADRVLPPLDLEPTDVPEPGIPRIAARNADAPDRTSDTPESFRRRAEPGPGAESAARHRSQSAEAAADTAFVSTPSGRFAARAPSLPRESAGQHRNSPDQQNQQKPTSRLDLSDLADLGLAADLDRAPGPGPAALPVPGSSPEFETEPETATGESVRPGRGTTGRPHSSTTKQRARHRSRHVRQAVVSVVALGAVGAAAAATAALLGITKDESSNQALGPAAGSAASSNTAPYGLHTSSLPMITGTVTSPGPGGAGGPGAQVPFLGGGRTGIGAGFVLSGTGTSSGTGGGSSAPGAADFYVSVNQRDGDPNSVTILLRNTGTTPIAWSARAADSWIALSQSSGTLAAGQETDVTASATAAAPAGQWTSSVTFSPGGEVVTLNGDSGGAPTSAPPSSASSAPTAAPSSPPPTRSAGGPSSGSGPSGSGGPSNAPSSTGPTASSAPAPASSAAASSSHTVPSRPTRPARPSGH
jgi:DNA-directed RNA polymerase specialized sigma24 family protein